MFYLDLFKSQLNSAKSFDIINSTSRDAEDGKSIKGSEITPSNLTSFIDTEERGAVGKKFSELNKRNQIDEDKILSELIDSNCSHSYHSNFKDSFKHLASPKKRGGGPSKFDKIKSKVRKNNFW